MTIAQWVGYQLAIHPTLRRVGALWAITQWLAIWSVMGASRAAADGEPPPVMASTLAGALNWTGITDSHGIPPGALFLSTVGTDEAITQAGPAVDIKDPSTVLRWAGNAATTGVTHDTVMQLLRAEASSIIVMMTLSVWFLQFAVSFVYVRWFAVWLRPFFTVIQHMLTEYLVFPICLTLGLAVGAWHYLWHGRRGHGTGIMLSTIAIGVIGYVLATRSLTELYKDDGPLDQARNLAFRAAQAFLHNGAITPADTDPWVSAHPAHGSSAQMHGLTTLIVDSTIRPLLQIMNFGTTIDQDPVCSRAYDTAILRGIADAPAHAMRECGNLAALSYAQHLDGGNLGLGAFFIAMGGIFSLFVAYVVYSLVMVGAAALITGVIAVCSAGPAMIHGEPQERARHRVKSVFRHLVMVFSYVLYACGAAVAIYKMAAHGGWADQVGMSHPVAKLVMLTLISAVALGVFWWLKRELGDRTRAALTHAISSAYHHARGGYERGRQTYQRGRKLGRKLSGADSQATQDAISGGGTDTPFTGKPAPGRPPGGRPPTAPLGRRPPGGPAPPAPNPAGAAAAAPGRAASGAAAGQAGAAAVVAPEAVIGAAVAAEATRRLRRDRTNRNDDRNPQARSQDTPPRPAPVGDSSASPVFGRDGHKKGPSRARPQRWLTGSSPL